MAFPLFSAFMENPSPSATAAVTREEFHTFHKIDRTLFTRLVYTLSRDVDQSFHAMGFLMMLEQSGYAPDLIASLGSLPDTVVDAVANEVSVCINLLFNHHFASTVLAANNDDNTIIPLLLRITKGRFTLTLINANREIFCTSLRNNWNDFCVRAFEDICEKVPKFNREKLMALEREKYIEELRNIRLGCLQQVSPNRNVQNVTVAYPLPPPPVGEEANKAAAVRMLSEEERAAKAAAEERTLFLTFSKGYPISEEEVRVYITRRLGDVIGAIEMQQVEGEQPLFAKLVLKPSCASMMEKILGARGKNKFTINGKHVWARKYVRKNMFSASTSTHV
ncbi:PREDICTED: uncharacterized protein LOC104777841 [Camelina sativa]|uniref:Uncharacterized protein LOC104777841 n=1 Tax=Camelina sativa TaxID=90675 RepID=A0ABM0YGB6_CAMSA|nr:PREDICTED: uncharacterized protein LOC104777841 [Camelina sativa]